MMPGTARDDAAAGCADLRDRMTALLDEHAGLMADVAADRDRPDLGRRMTLLTAAFRENSDQMRGHVMRELLLGDIRQRSQAAAVPAPRQHKGRHASASRALRVVTGIIAGAGITGALRGAGTALRHSWIAHPAATAAAAAAPVMVTAAITSAALTGSPVPGVTFSGTPAGQASAPGWHTTATPIVIPGPSPSMAAFARPKTGLDAARARGNPPVSLAAPQWPGPAASSPAAVPSSSPAPSSGSSTPAVPAALTLSDTSIDLTGASQATLTLTATGTGGWVAWKVSTQGTDLDFSATHGVLRAGQSCQLTVSLGASQDGLTAQAFDVNGQQVTVTLPPPPVPSAAPSDVASAVPSALPS